MTRLTIRGRALIDGAARDTAVVIEDGSIADITGNPGDAGGDTIDLKDNEILVPAGVDLGAHFRDWEQSFKETVETGTRGALAGGITTVCDMPNTLPRVNTVENIRRRIELFKEKSYCDFANHAMPPLDWSEAAGFKAAGAFAMHLFPWNIPDWNFPKDLDPLPAQFKAYVKYGLQGSIHVEEQSLRETPMEPQSELYALKPLLSRLDPEFRVRLRTSLASSVVRINDAKSSLPNMLVQSSVHYLFVSQEEAFRKIGIAGVGAPLLADAENLTKLQDLLRQGAFDICVSDHHPHRIQDKYHEAEVPGELWPKRGFTSLDFTYPYLLSHAGLAEGARLYSENPAKVLGVRRGKIATGYDADLAILEQGDFLVCPDEFESMGKVTPLAGEPVDYRVSKTFAGGVEVFDRASRSFTKRPIRRIA